MKIDFYAVEMPGTTTFGSLLSKADNLPNDKRRTFQIDGVPYRLLNLTHSGRLWHGNIVRIRMNDIPLKVKLSGATSDVDIEDDEGLGEENAFIFDAGIGVLVFQRNRFGAGADKFARYFEHVGKLAAPIVFAPIMRKHLINKLATLRTARYLYVRFAGVRNPRLLTGDGISASDAVELLGDTAPVVDIKVSMGRKHGSLALGPVKDVIKRLYKWATNHTPGTQEIESLKISGTFDEDSEETLNLLDYRIHDKEDVQVDAHTRRLLYSDRKPAIKRVYDRHLAELESIFPPE